LNIGKKERKKERKPLSGPASLFCLAIAAFLPIAKKDPSISREQTGRSDFSVYFIGLLKLLNVLI
jgi:hypothetical protein